MSVIRRADSASDRLRVLRVGHAATAAQQPFESYAAVRLRVPRRREGEWWLLEEDGEAASSLLCYPLLFRDADRPMPGYGIGAVATHPAFRSRGFASALCRHAVASAEAAGRTIGLLYSAIPPALYERLGFRETPAWGYHCTRVPELAACGDAIEFVPLDGVREAEALARLYTAHHEGLHLARDAQGVAASVVRNPEDVFFGIGDPIRGYVRLCLDDGESVDLVELVAGDVDRDRALRAVARLADRLGRTTITTWLPPSPCLSEFFVDRGRERTLPMLRGWEAVSAARFWASDYF